MRYRLILFVFLLFQSFVQAAETPKDSMVHALSRTSSLQEQVRIYRNLADLTYLTPESIPYLQQLYQKAEKAGFQEDAMEALSDLVIAYLEKKQVDSARYYINLISETAPPEAKDRWVCFLNMYLFNHLLFSNETKNITSLIDEQLKVYKAKEDKTKGSLYEQIEEAYIVGDIFYQQKKLEEAQPHMESAVELARKLPLKEGGPYQIRTLRWLAKIYMESNMNQEAIELLEKAAVLQEFHFNQYLKSGRPFYSLDDFYINNYTSLLINVRYLPEEKVQFYMSRLQELCRKTNSIPNKYNGFLAMCNYYLSQQEYEKALECNDSIIKYALAFSRYNLPGLYNINSLLYEALKRYPESIKFLRQAYWYKDSLQAEQMENQLHELQVEYGMDRLSQEKTQLEIRNKRLIVITLWIVLGLAIVLCGYLYINLKKERKRKEEIRRLKMRAEESEKMKTAFINSICHEIRTPLNAIVGFSDLMFDSSVDEEMRKEFPAEIQRNTATLTSMVHSMLEVSNLDVSDEKLPCERTDLAVICNEEFYRLAKRNIPDVECRIELSETPMFVNTNARYLALVLENLLSNAGKFTARGSIVLNCRKESAFVVISVTDTGCGIPADMQKSVFERFTKLDTYKQGSGLGLYLCQLIVKRLSGRICVDAGYTGGTRMVVEIPVA